MDRPSPEDASLPPDSIDPLPRARKGPAGLVLAAPAKINLNLLVGPRRPDGYHPLDSYVARVTLYDRIALRPLAGSDIRLICDGADCGPAEENLAFRAARLLAERPGRGGAEIRLDKRIPPGRGLGGGSSDAAAVLWGLNRLSGMDLPEGRLAALATSLGSDVPMFLGPPAARMTGRGERLDAVDVADFFALLWMPDFACGTGAVYAAFDEHPEPMQPQIDEHLLAAPVVQWRDRLVNQLAAPAGRVAPELETRRRRLCESTGLPVCVTGSGSALFALCRDRAEAHAAWRRLAPDLRTGCVLVRRNPW